MVRVEVTEDILLRPEGDGTRFLRSCIKSVAAVIDPGFQAESGLGGHSRHVGLAPCILFVFVAGRFLHHVTAPGRNLEGRVYKDLPPLRDLASHAAFAGQELFAVGVRQIVVAELVDFLGGLLARYGV